MVGLQESRRRKALARGKKLLQEPERQFAKCSRGPIKEENAMWYDLLILGILIYFTVRGAAHGVVWQLAGIAGLLICLAFAETISAMAGPYVKLQPPLNNWVVMFGAYLVFSFIAFGFARVINTWIEKAQMDYFNRHLGAVFGLVKGAIICLVLTFFVVTLSPAARDALKDSKTGYYAARTVFYLHPVMPEKLHLTLEKYIHQLDDEELKKKYAEQGHQHDHNGTEMNTTESGNAVLLGNAASGPPGDSGNSPWFPISGSQASSGSGNPLDAYLAQLPSTVDKDLKEVITRRLESTPPEQWPQLIQQLRETISKTRTEDLPALRQQLQANSQRPLSQVLADWTNRFLSSSSTTPQSNKSREDQMIEEISRRYSSIPPVQFQVQQDIRQKLSGLPSGVGTAVLEDWHHDLFAGPSAADPDPKTDARSPLENRIIQQLQAKGFSIDQLSREIKNRLDGAVLK